MSVLRSSDSRAVRTVGATIALAGFAVLLSYPYHMRYHYSVPVVGGHNFLPALSAFLSFVWAAAVAWGAATVVRGRVRSLTPATAWLAVPLSPLPMALDTFREPTTDAVPAPPGIANWTPPSGPVEVAARVFEGGGFWRFGAALFLALGVARARGQRRWLYGTAAALFLYAGAYGTVTTGLVHGMIVRPLVAAIPGSLLLVLGAKLAAPPRFESAPDSEMDAADATRA